MKKYLLLTPVLFICYFPSFSQDRTSKTYDFYLLGSTNLYLPREASEKTMFPIIGYNKATDPKLLIGGFGIGLAAIRSYSEKVTFKVQVNFNKITYWNKSLILRDENGDPVDAYHYNSVDFSVGLNATVQYYLTRNLAIGAGIGNQILLYSFFKTPAAGNLESEIFTNNSYKLMMPVIPFEISYKINKLLLSMRYEHALLNRYKNDLGDYKSERYGLLFFELGFAL